MGPNTLIKLQFYILKLGPLGLSLLLHIVLVLLTVRLRQVSGGEVEEAPRKDGWGFMS